LLNFIVDFYCFAVKLVIEIDGSQLNDPVNQLNDKQRNELLEKQGLKIVRFDNRQVLLEIEAVLEIIHAVVSERINSP
jgi:very-short-patch-repair endonuclease